MWSASRCIAQPRKTRATASAVEPLQPDDYQPALALLRGTPRPVVVVRHPRPDRLQQQSHGLARNRDKTFDPQDVVHFGGGAYARCQFAGIGDLGHRHNEAGEIVVVMLELRIMPGAAVFDIVLGTHAEPEQCGGIDLAVGAPPRFSRRAAARAAISALARSPAARSRDRVY